jgi:hypothetical protein
MTWHDSWTFTDLMLPAEAIAQIAENTCNAKAG